MVTRKLALAALLISCAVAEARGQGNDTWIVDGIRYAKLSTVGFDTDCRCQLVTCSACQKPDSWNGGKDLAAPAEGMDDAVGAPIDDQYDLIASNYGATPGSRSAAPAMIGDFFGGSYMMDLPTLTNGSGQGATNVPIAGGDRRFKLAENNSPFPVDRVFINYNRFHNALLTVDGRQANLNRAVFGLEKTFYDGLFSFEVRVPFANGLNADQVNASNANNVATEFGNIGFALKALLYSGPTVSWAAGTGLVIPTAAEGRVYDQSGQLFLTVENQAFYIQPFVGMLWTPNDRLFGLFITQLDFDTTGNRVRFQDQSTGVIQDQTLLFMDASLGYWAYRNQFSDSCVTGIAPMIELHYSTTISGSDFVGDSSGNSISNPNGSLDVLNITGGLRFEMRGNKYLTFAGVAPLRDGANQLFDAEFAVQYVGLY